MCVFDCAVSSFVFVFLLTCSEWEGNRVRGGQAGEAGTEGKLHFACACRTGRIVPVRALGPVAGAEAGRGPKAGGLGM